jgi:hypothetical protein
MTRAALAEVGQLACVCVASFLALQSGAAAADAEPEGPLSSGLGMGGAYLFGLLSGLVIFAVRYALEQRKQHLAEYGKE